MTIVEVRDSRRGYFIPVRYGLGLLPDGRVVGASPSPSSEVQVDILAGKLYLEFFIVWLVRDIWT